MQDENNETEKLSARAEELRALLCTPPAKARPPFILVHAAPGMGKSSLATEFPAPFFLYTEDPFPYRNREIKGAFIRTWEELHKALDRLEEFFENCLKRGEKLPFRTIVVDNISGLDNLVTDHLERAYNIRSLEDIPYGKGWAILPRYWESRAGFEVVKGRRCDYLGILPRLSKFRDRYDMCILLLAHSKSKMMTPTLDKPYDRACPHITRSVAEVITRFVDEIMYIYADMIENGDGVLVKTGFQFKSGNGVPGYESKTRGKMPESLPYRLGEGFRALAPYLPVWYRKEHVPTITTGDPETAEGGLLKGPPPAKTEAPSTHTETPTEVEDNSDLSEAPQLQSDKR